MKEKTANRLLIIGAVIFGFAMWWTPFWVWERAVHQERLVRWAAEAKVEEDATLAKLPPGCALTDLGPFRRAHALYVVTCDGKQTQTQIIIQGRKRRSQVVEISIGP